MDGTSENTGTKPNGMVNGCHEERVFLNELDASGGDLVSASILSGLQRINPSSTQKLVRLLLKKIQNLLKNKDFMKGIKKGLKYLGEL